MNISTIQFYPRICQEPLMNPISVQDTSSLKPSQKRSLWQRLREFQPSLRLVTIVFVVGTPRHNDRTGYDVWFWHYRSKISK